MEYFIYKDNKQQGPYTIGQLAEMGITSETLVWNESMKQWTPAWQVAELKDVLAAKAATTPAPPPVQPREEAQGGQEEPHAENEKQPCAGMDAAAPHTDRRKRNTALRLGVAALVFFLLLMTCPDERKHRDAVTHEIMEVVQSEMGSPDTGSPTIDLLGGIFGGAIAKQIVNAAVGQFMEVDNYFIFSVGTVHYGDESKTVSFGILGHVFTFSSDDLRKAIDREQPVPDTMAL